LAEPKLEIIRIKSLSEEAAGKIRQAIAAGRLQAGARLVETELARELGLSRSPVREALYLLEQEGLIVRYPRRGAFVRGLSRRETEEIYSLRTVLEGFAVQRALANMTPEKEEHLRHLVRDMRRIAVMGDVQSFGQLDAEFHEFICDIAEHLVLKQVINSLGARVLQYMTEANRLGDLPHIAEEHEYLLQSMLSGDPTVAVETMKQHILISAERLLAHYPGELLQIPTTEEVKKSAR